MRNTQTIIGVKELRQNLEACVKKINQGMSFVVVKRSKPIFNITPIELDENWEEVVDFTKIKKGGV
ncbi:MAG: type II toxin-antitoxin system prevent-host-death family antitoxin, partial [Candidatus Magasanikbacteria bacterium]